jgi:hypothetical protein
MGCLYALIALDFVAWSGLAVLFSGTLTSQGGIHAQYYFWLPVEVAAALAGSGLLLLASARVPSIRKIGAPCAAIVGAAALLALPVFLIFAGGGM